MSTFLDKPLQLPTYESTIPLELLTKVGMVKEGEFDANQKAIQGQLDKLGNFPIVKESDRQVISSKVDDLVNRLNEFSGENLGDSRTYNQLVGLTSNFYNDKDVYDRIADNTRATRAMADYQKMIKEDPDTYGASNAGLFMDSYNEWLNTPGSSFNTSYTPYYDNKEEINKIIDRVTKNPDGTMVKVMRTLPDGKEVEAGVEESKGIVSERIQAALRNSLTSKAYNQYMIDYKYGSKSHTTDEAIKEIDSHIASLEGTREDLLNKRTVTILPDLKNKVEALIKENEKNLQAAREKRSEVVQSNDPLRYYTFPNFITEKIKGIGDAYAFNQLGKIEWDPAYALAYKGQLDKELEVLKGTVRMTMPVAAKGKLGNDPTLPYSNDVRDVMTQVAIDGHATGSSQVAKSLLGGSGEIDPKDGSFSIPFSTEDVGIDLQPILSGQQSADATKAMGNYPIMKAYEDWRVGKSPSVGKLPGLPSNVPQTISDTTRGGAWMSSSQSVAASPQGRGNVTPHVTFDDWIKQLQESETGRKYIEDVKKKYNIDITSKTDMEDVRRMVNSPEMSSIVGHISTFLNKNALHGRLNVVPTQGDNIIRGSDGNPYVKVLVQAPKDAFLKAFQDGWGGDNHWYKFNTGFNTLEEKGIIQSVDDGKAEHKDFYQMPMYVRATADLGRASGQWVRDEVLSKGKATVEYGPRYEADFKNRMDQLAEVKDYINNPRLEEQVLSHIDELAKGSQGLAADKDGFKTTVQNVIKSLQNPDIPADKKYEAYYELKLIDKAQSADELRNILLHQGSAPGQTLNMNDLQTTLIQKFSKDYLLQNMDRMMNAIGAHEGNTNTVQTQTGALGRYQFLESTLQPIWQSKYNARFKTFDDFKREFLKNQTLQDNVMREWLLDLGSQVDYNPWRISLLHFLGPKGKDLSGISWNENPTANKMGKDGKPIVNATPAQYMQLFTNSYGGI